MNQPEQIDPARVERITKYLIAIKVPVEHHPNLVAMGHTEAKMGAAYAAKLMAKTHDELRLNKEIRMHVATECLNGILSDEQTQQKMIAATRKDEDHLTVAQYFASQAVEFADALLAELAKEPKK